MSEPEVKKRRPHRSTIPLKLDLARERSKDFYWFCVNILDMPLYEPLHRPVCDFLTNWKPGKSTKLLLLPRRHLKSSIASFALPIWTFANDPASCIFFSHGTKDIAKRYLMQVKRKLETDETLQTLWENSFFKNPARESPSWTQGELIVKRPADRDFRTPSMVAAGVEAAPAGMHFDMFILDDLVYDRECIESEDARNKTSDFIDEINYMGLPGYRKIILGTRWHHDDCYGRLIDPKNGNAQFVDTLIMDCGWRPGGIEADWEPIFPKHPTLPVGCTKAGLQEEYLKNPRKFGCQMMNNPTIEGATAFKRDDIQVFTPEPDGSPPIEEAYHYFTAVDPNRTEFQNIGKTARGADPCAIVTAAIDSKNHIWVVDVTSGYPNVFELVDWIFAHVERWKPKCVFFEAVNYQTQIGTACTRRMEERGMFFSAVPLERANARKSSRILAMQDRTHAKALHVRNGLDELIHQMTEYGSAKHDDQVEALADIHAKGYAPSSSDVSKNSAPRTGVLLGRILDGVLNRSNADGRTTARFG